MIGKQFWNRVILGTALAGGFLVVVGAAPAFADRDWSSTCKQRLEADRGKIDHDAARHGEHSPQVNHDVAHMDADRQWCRDHHSEWDHSRFDIGIYFRH